jgi:dihydrodipicolinate reductase
VTRAEARQAAAQAAQEALQEAEEQAAQAAQQAIMQAAQAAQQAAINVPAIQAPNVAAAPAVIFATYPGALLLTDTIDYATSGGKKLFESAVAAFSPQYN